ncbi:MAG TPA: NAD(P)/FAD-dependent oxidoreductase, partial [Rhizobacter sp.]|nr:NAD(P)/FAD-dependent oxidoreductase [Rhizobacter sp.]
MTSQATATQAMPSQRFSGTRPDVLVIGGGPAGSTVATLLADKGHDVVLFEKARHPRFHIGESLLPMNMPLFDRLGVRAEVEAIGITKLGAEFVSPWHDHTSRFMWGDAMDKSFPYAVHVRRSEFDELLFRLAATRGARALEGRRVMHVDMDGGGDGRALVKVKDGSGSETEWRPRFVIDASGRDTLLSSQFDAKLRNRKHASAALFGHFANAQRNPGRFEGSISLFWFDHGWFWFIPLRDGTTSIGAVANPGYFKDNRKGKSLSDFLMDTIALAPKLADRLKDATLLDPATSTGNYAYASKFCRGDRFVMIGDAYAFVDPMFSSGVYLAMNSAFESAVAVDHWLQGDTKLAEQQFRRFDKVMKRGPKVFSWFIYRITSPAIRKLF